MLVLNDTAFQIFPQNFFFFQMYAIGTFFFMCREYKCIIVPEKELKSVTDKENY